MVVDFEEIYKTYFGDVYRYILRLSADELLAEEITSETFFKALKGIDSFRGDCDVRVWLCQIAKNCYFSHRRKAARLVSLDETVLDTAAEACFEQRLCDKEDAGRIHKRLHTLPETYKEVFMWRAFADLSFKQIGQIFGKSDNWACVTYHRARAMLRAGSEESDNEK